MFSALILTNCVPFINENTGFVSHQTVVFTSGPGDQPPITIKPSNQRQIEFRKKQLKAERQRFGLIIPAVKAHRMIHSW